MKSLIAGFGSGALFAVGLGIAGMTKPSKVIGFLDLFGAWDASLAFVMVGAIAVYFVSYRLITKRRAPLFDARFHLPTRKDLDGRLVLGAAIFGIGWGLGGYCPGPGLVSAASGALPALAFVVSMAIGMKVAHVVSQRTAQPQVPPPPRSGRAPGDSPSRAAGLLRSISSGRRPRGSS